MIQTDMNTTGQKNNPLTTISLILGLAGIPILCTSFFLPFCGCLSGLTGMGAIITGFIGRQQINKVGGTGSEAAMFGIILGAGQVILVACGVILTVGLLIADAGARENILNMIPGLK